jgi:hypothetical protein
MFSYVEKLALQGENGRKPEVLDEFVLLVDLNNLIAKILAE